MPSIEDGVGVDGAGQPPSGTACVATLEERRDVASCLGMLVAAQRMVGVVMLAHRPTGLIRLDSEAGWTAAPSALGLHRAVATDHLAAIVDLLQIPAPHAPAIATLARSCVEAWGRAWWVLSAPSTIQAEYRARAMIVDELETGAGRGIGMLSGESIADAIARATSERDRLPGAGSERVPRYTALAKEMLVQAGAQDDSAAATIYSHLSGVAHGEAVFTESLTDRPSERGITAVDLPRANLRTYATTLFGVNAIATTKLVHAWGLPEDAVNVWRETISSTSACLNAALPK